jgi:Na+/H+ antiporter NhaC
MTPPPSRFFCIVLLALMQCAQAQADSHSPHHFEITSPSFVIRGVPFTLEITARTIEGVIDSTYRGAPQIGNVFVSGRSETLPIAGAFSAGTLTVPNSVVFFTGTSDVVVRDTDAEFRVPLRSIPGILTILPPLLAIVLALTLRHVIVSLFAGVWLGAIIIFDYNPFAGLYRVVDHFVLNALNSSDHISIIVFTLFFGGMVGIITRNGGTIGIAKLITSVTRTARSAQLSTWFLSFVMFFDDYTNVLVRGNLMRPITDEVRVSREKLSFIVDAGAASVASLMIISSWIGFEVGLIDQGLKAIGSTQDAYALFLKSIPFRFYPILTLIFVVIIALTRRDFGPMLKAERRARSEGKLLRDGANPATDLDAMKDFADVPADGKWYNGLVPIITIIVVTIYGLYATGVEGVQRLGSSDFSVANIISHSNSYQALLWSSFSACAVAVLMSVAQRILTIPQAVDAWFNGLRSMFLASMILVLAWSIGSVTQEIHTADYLVQILRGTIAPHWLPVLTFLIAAIISFATGTSWGTMAIMMPLIIPLGHSLSVDAGLSAADYNLILVGVVSSVLAGSVFGDHCSPISDTTILSSMASACDHVDHVTTQLPYAILVAAVGMAVGDIATAFGLPVWLALLLGTAILIAIIYVAGKPVDEHTTVKAHRATTYS